MLSLLSLSLVPAACATLPRPAATPVFDAVRFFAGRSEGIGVLRIVFRGPSPVHVASHGRVEPDGTLVLDQTVRQGDAPAATRQWRIRPTTPGHYAGTLSDAAGPVAGTVDGARLSLHFRIRGGLVADQALDLAPDGQSAHNRMKIRKFGLVVATLDETIRRRP